MFADWVLETDRFNPLNPTVEPVTVLVLARTPSTYKETVVLFWYDQLADMSKFMVEIFAGIALDDETFIP
jgi:hypothetical protein